MDRVALKAKALNQAELASPHFMRYNSVLFGRSYVSFDQLSDLSYPFLEQTTDVHRTWLCYAITALIDKLRKSGQYSDQDIVDNLMAEIMHKRATGEAPILPNDEMEGFIRSIIAAAMGLPTRPNRRAQTKSQRGTLPRNQQAPVTDQAPGRP